MVLEECIEIIEQMHRLLNLVSTWQSAFYWYLNAIVSDVILGQYICYNGRLKTREKPWKKAARL